MISLDEVINYLDVYDNKIIKFDLAKQEHNNEELKKKGEPTKKITIRKSMVKEYQRTLVKMPWKQCPCSICQQNGVEVIIFRGNNRNRRRGFHNTYVFYELLKQSMADDLFFVNEKHQEFESFYSQNEQQLQLF